ncbi:twin-arginine translocase subunit TatC [Corynebacterium alimapuense]|uniref:Sec-independent protein translocase protein TatC n=2 Tax=Corynebacterium alimapuense TaxID=1576874 RepID=A0A3M8K7F1_9CORY|nr:twin-arginine translocase subunit TatC [Corynebacterium alimapuense]RNE49143.1 twin-arginine translocase subunit TatC [Corynebacterium alimapuense]
MTLVDHIQEFRRRVIISLLALLVGAILGFIWYQESFLGTPSLGEILRGPYCDLPPENRADFSNDGQCRLLATGPFEMFMLRLKVGALAGLVLSSPVWLYQIWGFITPGLHKGERRWTFTFVFLAVTLFVAGAILAYFVVSYGLDFLLTIGDETQVAALTGERYYNFLLALLLIFGVSFEVPLIIAMLNIVGVLEYEAIKDKRRIIILVLFIFAAFMTPGQDPFSMVVLAFALTILVELALQFAKWNDRRRDRRRPEWMDLDDEASSPLSTQSGGIDAPGPLSSPAPIKPSSDLSSRENQDFGDVL